MVHIADSKVTKRFGDYFIRHIQKVCTLLAHFCTSVFVRCTKSICLVVLIIVGFIVSEPCSGFCFGWQFDEIVSELDRTQLEWESISQVVVVIVCWNVYVKLINLPLDQISIIASKAIFEASEFWQLILCSGVTLGMLAVSMISATFWAHLSSMKILASVCTGPWYCTVNHHMFTAISSGTSFLSGNRWGLILSMTSVRMVLMVWLVALDFPYRLLC